MKFDVFAFSAPDFAARRTLVRLARRNRTLQTILSLPYSAGLKKRRPKIASAVQLYGDVTIFDASASFLSPAEAGQATRIEFAKMMVVDIVYNSDMKTV